MKNLQSSHPVMDQPLCRLLAIWPTFYVCRNNAWSEKTTPFATKTGVFRYPQIAIGTTTSKPVFGFMNIQTASWRCSMAPESLPCMNPMERRLKMLKNRLREPLRPAEPRVRVLLAYGSQNPHPWKTEADNCHGT